MTTTTNTRTVCLIGATFDGGAGKPGASEGPKAVWQLGIKKYLNQLGHSIADEVRISLDDTVIAGADEPGLRNLHAVAEVNRQLYRAVGAAVAAEQFPLVIGGDHSLAIGSIAGVSSNPDRLGVIWFDAHSDMNTADTSPSGNIHGMSLAVLLGLGHPLLTSIGGEAPKLKPENVVIIGARDLDNGEKELIRARGIRCYTMHEIDRKGMSAVMDEALRYLSERTDGIHVSFDVDSLDPAIAPGTGTKVAGGLSYREAHLALELLHESGQVHSADFVELNPQLDQNNQTTRLTVELVRSLMGQRIL